MRGAWFLIAVALTACQAKLATTHQTVTAASTHPASSAAPATVGPPSPSAVSSPAPLAVSLVHGHVAIEAGYVISNDGGSVVSNGGDSFVSVGSATAVNPTALAGFFADASIVGDNGSGLIGNNSGSIISSNGSNLLSDHGVGLAARDRYRLASTSDVAPGTVLPARGMTVRAYSLRTGAAIDLAYADGTPVFPLTTDATGAFDAPIPVSEQGNVAITADVPNANDPRAQYTLVTKPGSTANVDEDTALVTYDIRYAFQRRLLEVLQAPDEAALASISASEWAAQNDVEPLLESLRAAAGSAGITTADAAKAEAMAQAATDALLASVPLETLAIDKSQAPLWTGPVEPAVPAFVAILQDMRQHAAPLLATTPTFFDDSSALKAANASPPPGATGPFKILKASDVGAFMVEVYLATNDANAYHDVRELFKKIGVHAGQPGPDGTLYEDQTERLKAAVGAITADTIAVLATDRDGARTQAIARIKAVGAAKL